LKGAGGKIDPPPNFPVDTRVYPADVVPFLARQSETDPVRHRLRGERVGVLEHLLVVYKDKPLTPGRRGALRIAR